MAVTTTLINGGNNAKKWTVTWALLGDTTETIAHGLGGAPDLVLVTPLNAAAISGECRLTSYNATQIVLDKTIAVGAGASVEVTAFRPGSML